MSKWFVIFVLAVSLAGCFGDDTKPTAPSTVTTPPTATSPPIVTPTAAPMPSPTTTP